ncbi:hypothetical protein [Undibacterium sp. Ji49W]|uniref:hypothetical protein n=1 Tax=Undibacterium sp. Ji49W TaxID=3413040 RepID=UPI003BF34565
MNVYLHHVSGFFTQRSEAESTLDSLLSRGIPSENMQIFDSKLATPPPAALPHQPGPVAGSDRALKDILVSGAIGTAVGTGLGALAEVALVAANVSLFIASPLIAPLVMMGWGASIGGLLGATHGTFKKNAGSTSSADALETDKLVADKQGWLSSLIDDAIISGQFVLVVQTNTEQETAIAQEVIEASVGTYKDDSIA